MRPGAEEESKGLGTYLPSPEESNPKSSDPNRDVPITNTPTLRYVDLQVDRRAHITMKNQY